MTYFKKMMGTTKSPPRVNLLEILWSWVGAFLEISSVALVHYHLLGEGADLMLIVALLVNNIPEKRRYPEFWI
ncbi:MAG: hypothetical protein U5R49_25505 [Deltaproteobacteria bacterium]|nr:hypothetical protein [Deltaproteobacteria bacterium]